MHARISATYSFLSKYQKYQNCILVNTNKLLTKNNFNYVFGGFTAANWSSTGGYIADQYAFIFSLRKNGGSTNYKSTFYFYTGELCYI